MLTQVTDATFTTEIEKHEGLVMVDFWAIWCGPCRVIAPSVEQLAGEYAGRVKVAKLDVDANPQTTMRFNVRSIPSVLFFKGGKVVDTVVGVVPKAHLTQRIEQHLG
jgi:thioredoxin 1